VLPRAGHVQRIPLRARDSLIVHDLVTVQAALRDDVLRERRVEPSATLDDPACQSNCAQVSLLRLFTATTTTHMNCQCREKAGGTRLSAGRRCSSSNSRVVGTGVRAKGSGGSGIAGTLSIFARSLPMNPPDVASPFPLPALAAAPVTAASYLYEGLGVRDANWQVRRDG